MAETLIGVEVCYAHPDGVWRHTLQLPAGSTVAQALTAAGLAAAFPDVDVSAQGVGIFGVKVGLDHVVQASDRIEIYRPLRFDPMTSRRRRAAHKARMARLAGR